MLFRYKFVPHKIHEFQGWINHLVKEVWCKPNGAFDIQKLTPDLREIVESTYNVQTGKKRGKNAPFLYESIRDIYTLFRDDLDPGQRQQIADWCDLNNDIETACANVPGKTPVTYTDVSKVSKTHGRRLAAALKGFFQHVWLSTLHIKAVLDRTDGGLAAFNKKFLKQNDEGKCPYCGLMPMNSIHHTRRDDYDHFLPKHLYPFNTVNFRNLAPSCDKCNRDYKRGLDPTRYIDPILRRNIAGRRKAFYSYAATVPKIEIRMNFNHADVEHLTPSDINMHFTASACTTEVDVWREVFGIDERYKALCCGGSDRKYWLIQLLDECPSTPLLDENSFKRKSSAEYLADIEGDAERYPWANCNFLKAPFLRACQTAGAFS